MSQDDYYNYYCHKGLLQENESLIAIVLKSYDCRITC